MKRKRQVDKRALMESGRASLSLHLCFFLVLSNGAAKVGSIRLSQKSVMVQQQVTSGVPPSIHQSGQSTEYDLAVKDSPVCRRWP